MRVQTFSASWDRTTWIISTLVAVLLLSVAIAAHSIIAPCLAALVIFFSYAYSTRGYAVSDQTLTIKRLIGDIHIPLDRIRRVRVAAGEDLSGCIRLWGSGGLFGYYGLYRTAGLGKSTWYVTNRSKALVLITETKTIVVSPNEQDGFLEAIRASVPAMDAPGAESMFQTLDSVTGTRRTGIAGALVGVAAVALAVAGMLYSPGAPGYTLTPESLSIHDRFYPVSIDASTVDVSGIHVVDINVDRDWRPTMRTNGFSNPHYHAGWFRVAGGQKVRMYRANSTRLVLLPPKSDSAPVLYEVADPDNFVAEVRREWIR
jgi:Bacterial PH domain